MPSAISLTGGAGAPVDAKYIVQEANAGLSAEQSLGALTTGLLKNTVTAGVGVLSKAVAADIPGIDAKYIVGAAHADLSAEIVKAYLQDNYDPDTYPVSPNAMDDEFEDGSINVKWTKVNDPAGANAMSETVFAGMLWTGLIEMANPEYEANFIVLYQAPPAGTGNSAMTWIAKVAVANPGDSCAGLGQYAGPGIIIWNPTNHEYVISTAELRAASSCMLHAIGYHQGAAANYALTASTTSNPLDFPQATWLYIKLEKSTNAAWTSANTYNMYVSANGVIWSMVGTESKTFTTAPSRIGLYWRAVIAAAGAAKGESVVDFFRRTV